MVISKKHEQIVFALLMSFSMAFIISLVMTLVNNGFRLNSLLFWPKSFLIGYIVAFPTAYFLSPVIRKITLKLIR
ncbi:conserved hypothetical protein [Methanococcus vannielii SB]|uniref:DUF2798 domain-containing protein n=1 Tax=Methanococcus vannielii (strain ATCC 35089 / DSM 1224 / JCM 13029 / OCM 148 / SB) TaxID=406327 RepID=A6URH8_METVS|nr:DUF2798 domain-containing protein [Methanococcus vannielii]ABR55100.1 conserved hypothetical protein [Methanococcus vannielii SB]